MPAPNQGHYLALGFHFIGALANDPDRGLRGPSFGGPGVTFRFGQAITDWLNLGFSIAVGGTNGEESLILGRLTIEARWYLSQHWFLHSGFGIAGSGGEDPEYPAYDRGRYGDVYVVGAGVNIFLSDSQESGGWILTPVASIEFGPDEDFTSAALWLGLEISWWSGLSRDQLDLPLDKAYKDN